MDEDRLQALIEEVMFEDGTMSLWQQQLYELTSLLAERLSKPNKRKLIEELLAYFE